MPAREATEATHTNMSSSWCRAAGGYLGLAGKDANGGRGVWSCNSAQSQDCWVKPSMQRVIIKMSQECKGKPPSMQWVKPSMQRVLKTSQGCKHKPSSMKWVKPSMQQV
eukprot:scaffold38665_cov18-Tisochrysis_lutea.AAC.1